MLDARIAKDRSEVRTHLIEYEVESLDKSICTALQCDELRSIVWDVLRVLCS